ncbi:phage integrase Arm DNA-binding domain-containing protein [Caballeronia sp. ATUFL_M1_KS5A]|uniref:phage integrase Arm DNA-binding domain-containing protein n=1 Tax=Caballeronia sp. ATUFL_M1_KS5A TaxID=2921778 RepID=UPI0020291D13|nr:phage integrase Arm DNA-binding domain-containing protein [Caballeronia sp. ATUFL_M1_KS5A]
MARPRTAKRVDLPQNLHLMERPKGDYFTYRSPLTGRSTSLGYDRERAIEYAKQANELVDLDRARKEANRIAIKHANVDEKGLLDGNSIVTKAIRYDQVCGVYFLIHGDMIVYVGQSRNILTRLAQHQSECAKIFDSFYMIECKASDLDRIEALYIRKFRPIYNVDVPILSADATAWCATLSDVLGF